VGSRRLETFFVRRAVVEEEAAVAGKEWRDDGEGEALRMSLRVRRPVGP
jgi:hypothetical protein